VLLDGSFYDWKNFPDVAHFKQTVVMLQDHYPAKLGMLFLVNIPRAAEWILALVKPWVSPEVREKMHTLSRDPARRRAELEAFVEKEYLPDWLGGSDEFKFDADTYYPKKLRMTEEEGRAFLTTMPYHAV
jgi:hypothetical protein